MEIILPKLYLLPSNAHDSCALEKSYFRVYPTSMNYGRARSSLPRPTLNKKKLRACHKCQPCSCQSLVLTGMMKATAGEQRVLPDCKSQRTSPLKSPFRQPSLVFFATSSLWTSLEPEKASHRCKGLVSCFEELCHEARWQPCCWTSLMISISQLISLQSQRNRLYTWDQKSTPSNWLVSILRPEEVGSKNEWNAYMCIKL